MGFIDYPMNPYPEARVYSDSGFCFSWVGALSGGICGPDNPVDIPDVSVNGAARRCDSRNNLDVYGPWPTPRNGGYCFVVDTGTSQGFFINVWE